MRDLTEGSIPRHVLMLAAPIGAGMLFQTLYYLVDLYFVASLGETAIAGVSAAGNVQFIVMALTQVLGVGTTACIAHAVGKKDQEDAHLVFNQSLLLAVTLAVGLLITGYALVDTYMGVLGADAASRAAGAAYLRWFLPGMALQFAAVAMGSALRGTGIVQPTMIVQIVSVLLNAVLSPMLIVGWLTGHPLGVVGAALASTLSVIFGVLLMWLYFQRYAKYVQFDRRLFRPQPAVWKRILEIGLPPGGEFALLFIYIGTVYWTTRHFGAAAQAGFGIGSRVMQAIFLPAMAVAFATGPVAGQNFGAGHIDRVRQTFRSAVFIGSSIMLVLTLLCQWRPDLLIGGFTDDPEVIAIGADFLHIISWNFVASGLIFTCSGLFQALGNTVPALLSSASRLITFVLPAVWLAGVPSFQLRHLWYLSVASVGLQALLSLLLWRRESRRRLPQAPTPATGLAT